MERVVCNTRAGEMHGTQTAQIRANERLERRRWPSTRTGMYNVYTETQNKIAVALPGNSIRVGPGRDGRESGGRERPAALDRAADACEAEGDGVR